MSQHIYTSSLTPEEAAKRKGGPRPLTREEVAEREVGTTTVTPCLSRWLIALFLLTILIVPLIQHVLEVRAGKSRAWWPKAADAVFFPKDSLQALKNPANPSAWGKSRRSTAGSCTT